MLESLHRVTFAGNFGDFSTNPEMLAICRHLKSINPQVTLGGDTNGMVQERRWWNELGEVFRDGELIFSLDGLEDTHALHRVGTSFHKALDNLNAFVQGGGIAHWKFIVFQHNEHQIETAAQLAEEAGCKRFVAISSRDYNENLLPPTIQEVTLKRDLFKNRCDVSTFSGCKPIDKKSIYIAADGTVHPCCFAHCMYITEHNELFSFVPPLIDKYLDFINFKTNSLDAILAGPYFSEIMSRAPANSYCHMKCSRMKKEVRAQLVLYDKNMND